MTARRKTSTKERVISRQENRAALRGYNPRETYSGTALRAYFGSSEYMPHHGKNVRYTEIIGRDGKRQGIARHRVV